MKESTNRCANKIVIEIFALTARVVCTIICQYNYQLIRYHQILIRFNTNPVSFLVFNILFKIRGLTNLLYKSISFTSQLT